MSLKNKSLLSISDLNKQDVDLLFKRTELFKATDRKTRSFESLIDFNQTRSHTAFIVFAESSTRTRVSFEMACYKLGMNVINFSDLRNSSMTKGETLEVTLSTLQSFSPSVLILRHEHSKPLVDTSIPLVNAGFGSYEHPTQALIDAFTILKKRGKIKGEKVLIIGDVLHSRVSNSNLKLLKLLGAEVAYCSPSPFSPKDISWKSGKNFQELDDGVKWASVVICLRIQKERHNTGIGLTLAGYRDRYFFGAEQLKIFNKEGIVLHPGPYVYGVEIGEEVLRDSRCCIKNQVENSVYIRSSLLSLLLDFEVKESSA